MAAGLRMSIQWYFRKPSNASCWKLCNHEDWTCRFSALLFIVDRSVSNICLIADRCDDATLIYMFASTSGKQVEHTVDRQNSARVVLVKMLQFKGMMFPDDQLVQAFVHQTITVPTSHASNTPFPCLSFQKWRDKMVSHISLQIYREIILKYCMNHNL